MERATEQFAGRFADWDPLGEGAGARLYRVRDRWTGHLSALKVAAPESADALVHEFRLLSRLRHPCLVESSDLVRDGGEMAHLLEYVPAVEPRTLWDRGGEDAVWAALTQALRGLTYLHRRGFVHGDVSPGNLLVWRDGERWRAKVADLGLTLPADRAAAAGVTGTPGFMAPETARGEGLSPASDLYGLAATASVWIDGIGPWGGMRPGEVLKKLVTGIPVPPPRRRISPELEKRLAGLGSVAADARTPGDWTDLRPPERWGPPGLAGTVVGVDDVVDAWEAWVGEEARGQVASIVLAGRRGTGRHTVHRALARRLVAAGWTALWGLPLDAVRDWLASAADDPDLVQIARELDRRFAGRDVVLVWPEASGESEARLFRAFVTARDGAGDGVRTLVLKQTGLQWGPDAEWLRNVSRCRAEEWPGVGPEPLRDLARDLFPPEDGFEAGLDADSFNTPLAIEQAKRRRIHGGAAESETLSVAEEVRRTWNDLSSFARDGLTVLAHSREGWRVSELAGLLGWDGAQAAEVALEMERSRLTRRSFDSDAPREHVTDWMTKEAIRGLEAPFPDCAAVDAYPDGEADLPPDLEFGTHLVRLGRWPEGYLRAALAAALEAARYQDVLRFREVAEERGAAIPIPVLDLFLRAAHGLGKYPEQEAILNRMLERVESPADAVAYRKQLGQVLVGLRRWQASVDQFQLIEESPDASEADRMCAGLQRAGSLWQGGRFEDADTVYRSLQERLQPDMREEWLRFAVGRAREFGQRGNMMKVQEYLDLAREKAGEEMCEGDALYLNTLGGLLMEQGDPLSAKPVMESALSRARASRSWDSLVMITSRAGSQSYNMGEMWEATKVATEGISTAMALGSQQLAIRSSLFVGYVEVQLGNLGSPYRRGKQAIWYAREAHDENQELQGHRLLSSVAAHAGWQAELVAAVKSAEQIGTRIGEDESVAYAFYSRSLYLVGLRNWLKARVALEQSLETLQLMGQVAVANRVRLLLALALKHTEGERAARGQLYKAEEVIGGRGTSPILAPLLQIVRTEIHGTKDTEELSCLLQSLWEKGRMMEIVDWGPVFLHHLPDEASREGRRKVVGAVQRIASSIDSAELRAEFLRFEKTKQALRAVQQ